MSIIKMAAVGAGVVILAGAVGFGVYETKLRKKAEAESVLTREDLASLQTQLEAVRRTGSKSEQRAVRAEEQLTAMEAKVRGLFPSVPISAAPGGSVGAMGFTSGSGGAFTVGRGGPGPQSESSRQERGNLSRIAIETSNQPFYRRASFTRAQRDRFNELMLESTERKDRSMKEALDQNPPKNRAAMQAVVDQVNGQFEREMLATVTTAFGSAAAEMFQLHQETLPMRGVANQLATALFYSEAPLAAAQADQVVEILSANARSPAGKVEVTAINKEAALSAARPLLSPLQVEVLAVQIDVAVARRGGMAR